MLVIFDIDDTLTQTGEPSREAFHAAFLRIFERALPCDNWNAYAQVTAPGILKEAVQATLGRTATPDEAQAFMACYTEVIAYWLFTQKGAVEVAGAAAAVRRLQALGHTVAVATGDYGESAELKLERAGFELEDCPRATADDDDRREAIVEQALLRAGGREKYDHVVYVGDGLWDLRATRALDLPLIGIDHRRTGQLQRAGVPIVISDYEDFTRFERCLNRTRS